MSFELRIHYTGLCLFAPDPTPPSGSACLHALLLTHHHRHEPRLIYDRAYERESSPTTDGCLRCRDLNDRALKIDGFGEPITPPITLPEEVVDLHMIAGVERLPRRFVEPDPGPKVAARVSTSVGRPGAPQRASLFTVPGGMPPDWPRRITTILQWKVKRKTGQDSVTLVLADLRSRAEPKVGRITLFPIGGTVDVWIYNALPDDLPPPVRVRNPGHGSPAEHFDAYYSLFVQGTKKTPVLAESPPHQIPPRIPSECRGMGCLESTSGKKLRPETAHTDTCITAQVPLE
ncbi:MAG TPA: hypothetical protein VHG28_12080 [Longimicrobiaceae bacterium]|nr:hypothetical protein [Longimicrobiaceae bacterium]